MNNQAIVKLGGENGAYSIATKDMDAGYDQFFLG